MKTRLLIWKNKANQISQTEMCCGMEEYISGEGDMSICMEHGDDWEDRFYADLNASSASPPQVTNEEEEEFDLEPPPPKITKYEDAIAALEDVRVFMDNIKGILKKQHDLHSR